MACVIASSLSSPAEAAGRVERKAEPVRSEEQIVRAAYAKLSMYNKASYARTFGDNEWLAENVALSFDLRDFRTGPISDLMAERWSSVATFPEGDVISIVSKRTETPTGTQASVRAEWGGGSWSVLSDQAWTVGEVLAVEHVQMHDVAKYTSYEVTVTLEGRSRTYRALALFHNRFDAEKDLVPTFIDNVAGFGGTLTEIFNETLPPYRYEAKSAPEQSSDRGRRIAANADVLDVSDWRPRDTSYHYSADGGHHGANFRINRGCKEYYGTHECLVEISGTPVEYGANTTAYYHGVILKELDGMGGPVPTTSESTCSGAAAVAVKLCIFSCSGSINLSVSPFTMTVSGSDFFYSDKMLWGATCEAREVDPVACEGRFGTAPQGQGGHPIDGGSTVFTGSSLVDACDTTPVIIDVAGDGYAMSSADAGVYFDMNGDGTALRISWTAAGSDDAFLVLDRNGDGRITTGDELFGNFTPQAASDHPNGFLALAELDRPENGGNGDAIVDAHDSMASSLRLWRDANHDGVSDASEMSTLAENGVTRLHINYKASQKVDEYGNRFRYRAKVDGVRGDDLGRWAWDVFLVTAR
jgi:hypothetical protein